MARMHFRAALPWLAPYPAETHFFDKLADDAFAGDFDFSDGTLTPTDAPGFGAAIDHAQARDLCLLREPPPMTYDSAKGNFRVALAGDCMLTRRLVRVRRAGVPCVARSVPRLRRRLRQPGIGGAAAGRRHAGRHPRHLHDDAAGAARRSLLARRQHGVDRQQPRLRLWRGRADGDDPASGSGRHHVRRQRAEPRRSATARLSRHPRRAGRADRNDGDVPPVECGKPAAARHARTPRHQSAWFHDHLYGG